MLQLILIRIIHGMMYAYSKVLFKLYFDTRFYFYSQLFLLMRMETLLDYEYTNITYFLSLVLNPDDKLSLN